MKKSLFLLPFLACVSIVAVGLFSENELGKKKLPKAQRIKEAIEWRERVTKDLTLGYAPTERLHAGYELLKRKQAEFIARGGPSIAGGKWRERGPYNVAGRTRAIMVDVRDPSGNTLFSGGVGGGIWRCTNASGNDPQWEIISNYQVNMGVTGITQSKIDPNIIFYCTGESSGGGARGNGVFRSTDGGATFQQLPPTANSNFHYCQSILAHPNGDIYVATAAGVYRTQDNGNTWTRVLGNGVSGVGDPFFWDIEVSSNNILYAASSSDIYTSPTGNINDWTGITNGNGFPGGVDHVEMSVSRTDPNIIYAVTGNGGDAEGLYRTINGGQNWLTLAFPVWSDGGNFTRGQAWYDLDIAVSPFDPNRVIVGGIDLFMSDNGGSSWDQISHWIGLADPYVHADQHRIIFDPVRPNVAYFGCDGGVFRSDNINSDPNVITFRHRNDGYNVTQFYACAISPEAFSPYALAGAQDNGSQQFTQPGISPTQEVLGGDGFYCFIDQQNPNFQMTSLYFGDFHLSYDGGFSFGTQFDAQGGFVCPSEYDSQYKMFYAQTYNGNAIFRNNVSQPVANNLAFVQVTGASVANLSFIGVDPNDATRIYVGRDGGKIVRIDNANVANPMVGVELSLPTGGTVSCVAVQRGAPNHLLATLSNFGLPNSIWESYDGGQSWVGVEGTNVPNNLPDMPVNWVLFNPSDSSQCIIATELGVWSTDHLDGANTVWDAPNTIDGSPIVPTYMLRMRTSDNHVAAATHGRGLWASDVFSVPTVRALFDGCHYTNSQQFFKGDESLKATSYLWDFGDGTSSTNANEYHTWPTIGARMVNLTINGSLTEGHYVKVLPDMPTPYTYAQGGDFESNLQDFGSYSAKGSTFDYGSSNVPGKNGTKSGNYAYVLGRNEQFYQPNTDARLYTPCYDFTEPGIYEISFWAKHKIQNGRDGIQVQYSLDKGQTWSVLGSDADPDWYNTRLNEPTAFPANSPFISGNAFQFKQYKRNVSEFIGQPYVAFRIVFRSENTGNYEGVVIDDWQVRKEVGALETRLTNFTAAFQPGNDAVDIDFSTYPEYRCSKFILYRLNQMGWDSITTIQATPPGTSLDPHDYEYTNVQCYDDIYLYRLKVVGIDTATNFWSDVVVARRYFSSENTRAIIHELGSDDVTVFFNFLLTDKKVTFELYNDIGQQVMSAYQVLTGTNFATITLPGGLATGAYILRVSIEGGETFTKKFLHY